MYDSTGFTKARQQVDQLPCVSWIQFIPRRNMPFLQGKDLFILHFHLCLDRPSDVSLPGSPNITLYRFPNPSYLLSAPPALISWIYHCHLTQKHKLWSFSLRSFVPILMAPFFHCYVQLFFSALSNVFNLVHSLKMRDHQRFTHIKIRDRVTMLHIQLL